MTDLDFMKLALEASAHGVAIGQSPFGACIVRNDEVVICTHNVVLQNCDSTGHAEINAIRQACQKLGTIDLSDCTIYSTTEPCPMCFTAIHWAGIKRIVFGSDISDAQRAGFNELPISNLTLRQLGSLRMEITPHVLHQECVAHMQSYKGKVY